MEKEFIPYQEALALKELGFDEPCFGYWKSKNWLIQEKTRTDGYTHADQECSAPLYQQAFRWFREKHDLVHRIDRDGGWWICTILNLYDEKEQGTIEIHIKRYPDTYEEAEQACLIKLIEIVKTK